MVSLLCGKADSYFNDEDRASAAYGHARKTTIIQRLVWPWVCVSAQQTVCQGFYNILPSSPYIDVPLTHNHKNSKINTNTRYKDIRSSYIYRGNPGRRRLRFPKQTLEHSCGATVLSLQLTKERGNQTVTQVISTVGQKGRGVPGASPSVRSAWLPLPASPATVSHSVPSRHEPHG